MRAAVLALLSIVVLPLFLHGQSTLDFPRAIQPSELSKSGFAVVNPGPADAAATFTLYRTDGSVESSSAQTIPARGQLSKLGTELFPAAINAGWVEMTSASTGLQGFWIGGDLATFADGAEAAPSAVDLVLPFLGPSSELHVADTSTGTVTATLRIYGEDGLQLAEPVVLVIVPKGFVKSDLAALFPSLDLTTARHLRLTCVNPFAALVVVKDFIGGPSWAVVNAVPASLTQFNINFPHVVDGQLGNADYKSVIGVTNLSRTDSNDVTLTFLSSDGVPFRSVQRTLPPNGGFRDNVRSFFGLAPGFQNGWVRITSQLSLPLTGFVLYADSIAGSAAATAPQTDGQTNLLFAHIADLFPWWTGLALLNASAQNAIVEMFAMAPNGSLIGKASFGLPAGKRVSQLLSQWIPQTQNRASDGGFVFVRSDVPLFGTELFFSRNLLVLANVTAGRILPGVTYVPPSP